MSTYYNIQITKEQADIMVQLLKTDMASFERNVIEKMAELSTAQEELSRCKEMIANLLAVGEYDLPLDVRDRYSKGWKSPAKILFILKELNRKLTAKDILKFMQIQEGEVDSKKRSSIFAALNNLSEHGTIEKEKENGEYRYSLRESTISAMDDFKDIIIDNNNKDIEEEGAINLFI